MGINSRLSVSSSTLTVSLLSIAIAAVSAARTDSYSVPATLATAVASVRGSRVSPPPVSVAKAVVGIMESTISTARAMDRKRLNMFSIFECFIPFISLRYFREWGYRWDRRPGAAWAFVFGRVLHRCGTLGVFLVGGVRGNLFSPSAPSGLHLIRHAFGVPPSPQGEGFGEADCHSQCAHWLRNDILKSVSFRGGHCPTRESVRGRAVLAPTECIVGAAIGRPCRVLVRRNA